MSYRHKKIGVIVIDDSLFMRQMISDILNADSEIEVLGTASNGNEGLLKIKQLNPDVVTLDYEMPELDGVTALKWIMRLHPTPVVMISAHTKEGGTVTLDALAEGAIDYVLKPSGTVSLNISKIKKEIIDKVKLASEVSIDTLNEFLHKNARVLVLPKAPLVTTKVVVIGSSTGGTKGIELILQSLPAEFPVPILIVQHMPELFTTLFADRLNRMTKLIVKEGEEKEKVTAGTVYIAPGGKHMKVVLNSAKKRSTDMHDSVKIKLTKSKPVFGLRPAINILMQSVAEVYSTNAVGIILSGMGSDGTDGLCDILSAGGKTISQDERTSVVYSMPRSAIEAGAVEEILPIDKIAPRIIELMKS